MNETIIESKSNSKLDGIFKGKNLREFKTLVDFDNATPIEKDILLIFYDLMTKFTNNEFENYFEPFSLILKTYNNLTRDHEISLKEAISISEKLFLS